MPHKEGPITILRSRRTSFQNTEETAELEFRLASREGVDIYAIEFGIRGYSAVPSDDAEAVDLSAHLSVHLETGDLEGSIDSFPADATILNSEIIAETTLHVFAFISSVAATSGNAQSAVWLQPISWNYLELIGKPLTIAQNLTFRGVASASTLTVNGAQVTIFYRIRSLSDKDIVGLFSLRR